MSAFCGMLEVPDVLYEFSSVVFFLLPMVIMVILYTRMGITICKTGQQQTGPDAVREKTKRDILKMLGNYFDVIPIYEGAF